MLRGWISHRGLPKAMLGQTSIYGSNLGATIEYDNWDGKSPPKSPEDDKKEKRFWFRFLRKWWSK